MSKKKQTPVQKIFYAFTDGNWHTMNWTGEKGYHAWSDFWFLLISSGFAFEKSDLISIKKFCNESRYSPLWQGVDEGHYSLAVRCGNLTFAYAFEELEERMPFIGIGLEYYACYPSFSNHATQAKSAGRLVMGTHFIWMGEEVKVTSFKDDVKSLIACAYHPDPEGYSPSKIKKRFTISHTDFKQEMSKRRTASAASEREGG